MTWAALRDHIVQAIAGAALLGGGVVLIDSKVENARQDERIKVVEAMPEKLDKIIEGQLTTNERLTKIETRLED